jgi:uncharacterized protein (TIGR02145 family)
LSNISYKIDEAEPLINPQENLTNIFKSNIMNLLGKLFSKDETENKAFFEYYILDNKYKTVKIGNQQWMVENLNIDNFRNSDTIPEVKDPIRWANGIYKKEPAWCYYENNYENGEKYGKLYNWFAVNDPRGLAPEGWHIPSVKEWKELLDYLGGYKLAGKKMKNTNGWDIVLEKGRNESGFSALPGGFRDTFADFRCKGDMGYWWSSTDCGDFGNDFLYAFSLVLGYEIQHFEKDCWLSVRCVRNLNINIIKAGMTYEEVVRLIGPPTIERGVTASDIYGSNIPIYKETDVFHYFERYPECNFSIHFSHNKVVSIQQYPKSN